MAPGKGKGKGKGETAARLPSGRHKLSREFVINSQRDRVLDAMARECAEKGYGAVSIGDIVATASVSRTTFYELFADKEACFLAATDAITGKFLGEVVSKCNDDSLSWPEQTRAGLEVILNFMVAEPDFARMCILDVQAAGPLALERYQSAIRLIASFVDRGRTYASGREELPANVGLSIVGGGAVLVRDEILAGRIDRLPELLPELLYMALVPYLGQEEARRYAYGDGKDVPAGRSRPLAEAPLSG